MSLHICLVTPDLKQDHPEWNWEKFTGDHLIANLLKLPVERHVVDEVTIVERPADFTKWRDTLSSWPTAPDNTVRFTQMIDLLESNPDYWIYLSV